jgi:hypothetical protein
MRSNRWASVGVAYRGVEEELSRIFAPFFVALVRLIISTFVEAVAGSGGRTGSRVLLTVAVAAAAVNAGVLGIKGTGSRALLRPVATGMVNVWVLGIGRAGSKSLQMVAVAADITNIGVLGIGGTGLRVLLTVVIAAAAVGM